MTRTESNFAADLINWYSIAKRDLPWRHTQDPYKIWLSEIILQQTRIDQGLPYYYGFIENFPTVHELAAAPEQEVLKLWEGLGYYSRARNLHHTARVISTERKGEFPNTYSELRRLRGVGPYTAAAIASMAFGEPVPVIDGNVFRFISRYFGIDQDIMAPRTRSVFEEVLSGLISTSQPGVFNQAVMEYGATVCKPSPACGECQFAEACYACTHRLQATLPVKSKKAKVRQRFIAYLVFEHGHRVLMRQRTGGIWTGLFEFYNLEREAEVNGSEIKEVLAPYPSCALTGVSQKVKHLLSHRKLWVTFYHVQVKDRAVFRKIAKDFGLTEYSRPEVLTLPRPKVIVNHLGQWEF